MRYVGQEYTVNLPIGATVSLEEIDGAFHDAHRVRYGHSTPSAPAEFVNLRVAAMGRIASAVPKYNRANRRGRSAARTADGRLRRPASTRRRCCCASICRRGRAIRGPVVIEEESSTTVVPPGHTAALDELGNVLITRA